MLKNDSFNKYKCKIIKYIKYHKIGVQMHNYKIYQISLVKKYFLIHLTILKVFANKSILSNYLRGEDCVSKSLYKHRTREHVRKKTYSDIQLFYNIYNQNLAKHDARHFQMFTC